MTDAKASILVVDDDAAIRELLQEHLSRVGYEIRTAADGDQMRQLLGERPADLIVLDVMLPGDDGFTLCRQIREHSQVPIIMLTASSDETDRVVGLEIGADDYLDRKSTRLNSSHVRISYAVFCSGAHRDLHSFPTRRSSDLMRQLLGERPADLIVLDVMLPGDDGFTLCRQIREHSQVPIIMLTASSDETDRVVGLEIGADDYLAKPFSARELQARVKALLRRARFARADNPRFVLFDSWRLDTLAHELIDEDGEATALSGADFALLQLFLTHPNQVLDRDTISGVTRGRESMPLDRVVDVAVSRLRQRLGDQGRNPRLIKTVRGAGYLLATTVSYAPE